jgi:hypothetical protein
MCSAYLLAMNWLARRAGESRTLEGLVTGLEWHARKLRAVWVSNYIIQVEEHSCGVSNLRLNRPVQLVICKKGPHWVLREVTRLPVRPTLIELEPLKTPPLVGFALEATLDETHFSHPGLRYI